MEVHATLNADPKCVSEARKLTRHTLESWGMATLGEVAVLLVSELATNAILHARSPVGIIMRTNSVGIRVYVCDDSPAPPRVRRFRTEAATGRGVRLLETLASSWGVQSNSDGGKCVWFTLMRDGTREFVEWEYDAGLVEPL